MSMPVQEPQKEQASLSIIDNVNLQHVSATMQKIAQFQAVVQRTLKKDHDYGIIPGTGNKPTLLKPGAEKILMLMGLTSEYDVIEKVQDYERGFFAFTVKCTLSKGDIKVTEGVGHANTKEKRYTSGKQQDPYTLANTVLKMAKKRAQVDAVLTVASLSEIFTQDLEDQLDENGFDIPPQTQKPLQQKSQRSNADNDLERARKALFVKARELGYSNEEIKDFLTVQFNTDSTKNLTKNQIVEFIRFLEQQKSEEYSEEDTAFVQEE